ncbi:hypothetical protein C818_01285 [Lachnospiraceae bacterium MD308]|nr:hypothetical protein C818_01285 [Lachnospiraceae bacterium MD308]
MLRSRERLEFNNRQMYVSVAILYKEYDEAERLGYGNIFSYVA